MKKHHLTLAARILLSFALATVMTLAAASVSSATSTEAQLCPPVEGFVCLAEVDGGFQLIPEGKSRSYPDGLPVIELWNNTKSDYCVGAKPFNFGLGAGELASEPTTVFRIGPGKICLT